MANAESPRTPSSTDGGGLHNSVLIRTHEPPRSDHSRLYAAVMGLAVIMGIGAWAFVQTHPGPPIVSHAVAADPATPATGGG